ncbi:hypothetical protein JTE90_021279 [Oedothorax gibbosus]|uniref:Uncharacterized protein n=1 Tax=Oedothorax gibbosus TaxID=931172 RepID=A0AAV6U737_9ARAC|nr:hypothetical protein JTE90_021279 [Oedothorax gibbosus]
MTTHARRNIHREVKALRNVTKKKRKAIPDLWKKKQLHSPPEERGPSRNVSVFIQEEDLDRSDRWGLSSRRTQ